MPAEPRRCPRQCAGDAARLEESLFGQNKRRFQSKEKLAGLRTYRERMSEADISMQTNDATAVRPRSEGHPMDVAFGSSKVTSISILQRLLSFPMMLVALLIG